MKRLFIILRDRWQAKTPLIFSRIIKIAMGIGMTAAAIQAELMRTGADTPDWWVTILPYLVGAGAGASAVAKLTQQYDRNNRPVRKPRRRKYGDVYREERREHL